MTYFSQVASGSEHGLRYCAENTFGITPGTPTMVSLRHTGCSVILSKDTFQSAELRSDRQITDFRHGTYQVGGDINSEISYAEFDPLFAGGFGGTWQASLATKTAATIAVQGTLNQFYSASATFTTLATGDVIRVTGAANAANNGVMIISAAKQFTFTVLQDLVTAATGATINIKRQP